MCSWLDQALDANSPIEDVLARAPALSAEDAYKLQFAVMERRVDRGDRIVGYKAALTSAAMQAQTGVPEPMLGTLLGSRTLNPQEPISISANRFMRVTLEPEIAVLLKSDLSGPGVTALDALAAIAGYLPAVEIGDYRVAGEFGSLQMGVVCNTFNGAIVVGNQLTPPTGIDIRLEGMSLAVNGQAAGFGHRGRSVRGSAKLGRFHGEQARGIWPFPQGRMILMTGSIVASVPLQLAIGCELTSPGWARSR